MDGSPCRARPAAGPFAPREKSIMTNYAVFLQGDNFELSREGRKQLLGFFVTVRVEAESEAEAGNKAIRLVKSDSQLADAFMTAG